MPAGFGTSLGRRRLFTPVPDSHLCCGSAGGYSILQPEIAAGRIGRVSAVHGRYACDDMLVMPGGWRVDPAASGPSTDSVMLPGRAFGFSIHPTTGMTTRKNRK